MMTTTPMMSTLGASGGRGLAACIALLVLALAPMPVQAQTLPGSEQQSMDADSLEVPSESAVDDAAEAALEGQSRFRRFIESEVERIVALDLYGVTSQLPRGWLKVKWDLGTIEASNRYNRFGELGPVIDPIEFELNGQTALSANLGLSGSGGGHTFQMSYGITDPLDWYIEIPFTYQDIEFTPTVAEIDDEGNRIAPGLAGLVGVEDPKEYDGEDLFYDTLPRLGRPTPDAEYHAKWLLGDVNTGFSWNFVRNHRYSAALTPRIFLPTGHIPDPDQNLTYGTGPALETGTGGWATSTTFGFDLRLWKPTDWLDLIASSETTVGYAFQQQREYPTSFVTPDPAAQTLDPESFPDLSDLEGTFDYVPGWSFDWSAQLTVQLAVFGLSAGYGVQHNTEPLIRGDRDFVSMVDSLELLGASTGNLIQLGASVSLLPLYIPANLGFSWRKAVAGRDVIVFDNFFQFTVEAFAPVFLIWDRD